MLRRQRVHTSSLSGCVFVQETLDGHWANSYNLFRMRTPVFLSLCDSLKERGLLRDSSWVIAEEQLAVCLLTLSHNERNWVVQSRFQHSGETISRHFHIVLDALLALHKELILPATATIAPEILHDRRFYPWFKDCIGAIDGTHIPVRVPIRDQPCFHNRKNNVTQNVLAAMSFDMRFQYVLVGWEGQLWPRGSLTMHCREPKTNCESRLENATSSMEAMQTCSAFLLHIGAPGIT